MGKATREPDERVDHHEPQRRDGDGRRGPAAFSARLCLAGSPLQLELLVAAGFMPIATGRTSLPRVSFDSACQRTLESLSARSGNEHGLGRGGAIGRPDLAVWSDLADYSGGE